MRRQAAEEVALAVVAGNLVGGLLARATAPEAVEEGEEGEVRWRLEPIAPPAAPGGETTPPPLVEVRITIEGPGGRRWEIASLLPPAEEAAR